MPIGLIKRTIYPDEDRGKSALHHVIGRAPIGWENLWAFFAQAGGAKDTRQIFRYDFCIIGATKMIRVFP